MKKSRSIRRRKKNIEKLDNFNGYGYVEMKETTALKKCKNYRKYSEKKMPRKNNVEMMSRSKEIRKSVGREKSAKFNSFQLGIIRLQAFRIAKKRKWLLPSFSVKGQ